MDKTTSLSISVPLIALMARGQLTYAESSNSELRGVINWYNELHSAVGECLITQEDIAYKVEAQVATLQAALREKEQALAIASSDIKQLHKELDELKADIGFSKSNADENKRLREENDKLMDENTRLIKEYDALQDTMVPAPWGSAGWCYEQRVRGLKATMRYEGSHAVANLLTDGVLSPRLMRGIQDNLDIVATWCEHTEKNVYLYIQVSDKALDGREGVFNKFKRILRGHNVRAEMHYDHKTAEAILIIKA